MKEKESLVRHSSVRGIRVLLQETVSHFLIILAPPGQEWGQELIDGQKDQVCCRELCLVTARESISNKRHHLMPSIIMKKRRAARTNMRQKRIQIAKAVRPVASDGVA